MKTINLNNVSMEQKQKFNDNNYWIINMSNEDEMKIIEEFNKKVKVKYNGTAGIYFKKVKMTIDVIE